MVRLPTTWYSGSLTFEAPTRGLGTFLKAALGAVTNTAVVGDATVFQQVHTPAVDDLAKSYTIQKGLPLLAGAVQPIPVYRRGSRTPAASGLPSPARAARTPSPTGGAEVPALVLPAMPAAVPAQPAAAATPLPTPQLPGDSSFVF